MRVLSLFFFFCHKTTNSQERKKGSDRSIDRSIDRSERHLFSSSLLLISFLFARSQKRESNERYIIKSMTFTSSSAFPATTIATKTIATRNAAQREKKKKKRWSLHRANLFGKPNTGETATKESLQYELEKANKWREELVAELSSAKKERDEAVESLDLYKRRLKEAEKDVFKLEKLTQEQEQKFNAFEIVVKNQIKLLEGMVKERDEMLAKSQPPPPP